MENQVPNNQEQPQAEPQAQAPKSYNPFIANVNEKAYTQMNVNAAPHQMAAPIPEPNFQSNTVSSNENAYNMLNNEFSMNGGAAPNGAKDSSAPFNPAMNNIPSADQELGADHLAKLIIDGYEQLHTFANKALQIPERKLRKMVADGELDLSVQIPYEYGKTITAGEFIQDFNEQNKDTLTVTKEFKKETTPVLKRVLLKRGAGITDEQMLLYLFGKDIAVKGVIVSQIRGTMNDMLDIIKEHTVALRESGHVAQGTPVTRADKGDTTPPPPPPTKNDGDSPRPRKTPPPPPAPKNEDDFNFRTNEVVVDSAVVKHVIPDSGKAALMKRKKRDEEIAAAMGRADKLMGNTPSNKPSYKEMMAKRKSGSRGKKTSDYVAQVDEAEIAEAIILNEQKPIEKDKIEGLD